MLKIRLVVEIGSSSIFGPLLCTWKQQCAPVFILNHLWLEKQISLLFAKIPPSANGLLSCKDTDIWSLFSDHFAFVIRIKWHTTSCSLDWQPWTHTHPMGGSPGRCAVDTSSNSTPLSRMVFFHLRSSSKQLPSVIGLSAFQLNWLHHEWQITP